MAFAPASTLPALDPIKSMFEKQVSEASTVLPAKDDFSRDTTLEQDLPLDDGLDFLEARGGMAERLAWQLPAPAEDSTRVPCALPVGKDELDFYEARGGMAEQLSAAAGMDMDEYEARGGIAAQLHCMLPGRAVSHGLPKASEGDEYEMRGGMSAWSATDKSKDQGKLVDDVDAFEARGGMVEKFAQQLQLPIKDLQHATRALFVGGQEVDVYEGRGGMAEQLFAVAGADADEYEARGGFAAPVQRLLPGCGARQRLAEAAEGDEYELRGGMLAWAAVA